MFNVHTGKHLPRTAAPLKCIIHLIHVKEFDRTGVAYFVTNPQTSGFSITYYIMGPPRPS